MVTLIELYDIETVKPCQGRKDREDVRHDCRGIYPNGNGNYSRMERGLNEKQFHKERKCYLDKLN